MRCARDDVDGAARGVRASTDVRSLWTGAQETPTEEPAE